MIFYFHGTERDLSYSGYISIAQNRINVNMNITEKLPKTTEITLQAVNPLMGTGNYSAHRII